MVDPPGPQWDSAWPCPGNALYPGLDLSKKPGIGVGEKSREWEPHDIVGFWLLVWDIQLETWP